MINEFKRGFDAIVSGSKVALAKDKGNFAEMKRWFWQVLMMVGAVPYTFISFGVLSYGGKITLDELSPFWMTISNILWLGPYYLLSAFVHFRVDRFLSFERAWWLSPRIFVAALPISFTLCFRFCSPPIAEDFLKSLLKQYPAADAAHFFFFGLGGLHLSSVLLTWVLSEWFCRLRNRYQIKNWRILGRA